MQDVSQSLNEVKDLFQRVVGQPAPRIDPHAFSAFPLGVDPVDHAFREVEHLKQLTEQIALSPSPVAWTPRADIYVADDAFVIRLEVPGMPREDLKVFVVGGECVVRGERKREQDTAKLRAMTLERPWGPFERRFVMPAGSHPGQLKAHYKEGILELRIATEAAATPKKTKIDVA